MEPQQRLLVKHAEKRRGFEEPGVADKPSDGSIKLVDRLGVVAARRWNGAGVGGVAGRPGPAAKNFFEVGRGYREAK
jgi:hypothetical protein